MLLVSTSFVSFFKNGTIHLPRNKHAIPPNECLAPPNSDNQRTLFTLRQRGWLHHWPCCLLLATLNQLCNDLFLTLQEGRDPVGSTKMPAVREMNRACKWFVRCTRSSTQLSSSGTSSATTAGSQLRAGPCWGGAEYYNPGALDGPGFATWLMTTEKFQLPGETPVRHASTVAHRKYEVELCWAPHIASRG